MEDELARKWEGQLRTEQPHCCHGLDAQDALFHASALRSFTPLRTEGLACMGADPSLCYKQEIRPRFSTYCTTSLPLECIGSPFS